MSESDENAVRGSRLRRLGLRATWFLGATLLGGGCDLGTKDWAETSLGGVAGNSRMLIDPWLEMSLAYNRGTAFSMVRDLGDARLFFGLIALAVIVVMLVMALRNDSDRLDIIALGAIAGGALGNGIDRLFRAAPGGGTGVVDFVKINYPWGGSWPAFNIADALILVGVAVLLLRRLRKREEDPGGPEPSPAPG